MTPPNETNVASTSFSHDGLSASVVLSAEKLDEHLTHVWPLDHHGDYALISVERIRQLAPHLQAHLRDGVYFERIAANYVDNLVLLIPAHDTGVLGCIERKVRFFGRAPSQHSPLQICKGQFDLANIGDGRKALSNLGFAALLLCEGLRACDVG